MPFTALHSVHGIYGLLFPDFVTRRVTFVLSLHTLKALGSLLPSSPFVISVVTTPFDPVPFPFYPTTLVTFYPRTHRLPLQWRLHLLLLCTLRLSDATLPGSKPERGEEGAYHVCSVANSTPRLIVGCYITTEEGEISAALFGGRTTWYVDPVYHSTGERRERIHCNDVVVTFYNYDSFPVIIHFSMFLQLAVLLPCSCSTCRYYRCHPDLR